MQQAPVTGGGAKHAVQAEPSPRYSPPLAAQSAGESSKQNRPPEPTMQHAPTDWARQTAGPASAAAKASEVHNVRAARPLFIGWLLFLSRAVGREHSNGHS